MPNTRQHSAQRTTPRITFVAQPDSVHVAVWTEALAGCGLPVRIETAAPVQSGTPPGIDVEFLTPGWLKGPSFLRYLWAGIAARLKTRAADEIVHAHCTSGNGMVAWMAGHPYIVTTYGSEVLAADQRSRLYRWLIHRVLKGADRITATSPQMADVLTDEHGIPRDRIHLFDLGLNTDLFHPATEAQHRALRSDMGIGSDEPVWISVKRAIPMNRTIEIVTAFDRYCDDHPTGRLVVICGDDSSNYSDEVKRQAAASPHADRIIVLSEWLDPPDVARWLQLADFAISVPTSDQMSNAVLEAMACGTVPILLSVDGYRTLRERDATVHWLDECSVDSLTSAFEQTAAMPLGERARQQLSDVGFIRQHYSNRRVWEVLQRLYNLPAADDETSRHAA